MEIRKPRRKNSAKCTGNAKGDTVNRNTLVGRIDEIRNLKTVNNASKTLIISKKI